MQKRIFYSQNFIKNKDLIKNLIKNSSITSNDLVIDIGAGLGSITKELLNIGSRVVAFEIDEVLIKKLQERFLLNKNLEIVSGDFLKYSLPRKPFKVFSNIPFNITSQVIKKLVFSPNPPLDCYIVVQKETVERFIGKPYDNKNSQISILFKPCFKLTVEHKFKRSDFSPIPNVDCFLMRIEKRKIPLVRDEDKEMFYDFVSYTFNQRKPGILKGLSKVMNRNEIVKIAKQYKFNPNSKPSELELKDWTSLFNYILNNSSKTQNRILKGTYNRLNFQQQGIKKINRTRLDKKWRNLGATKGHNIKFRTY